MNDPPTRIRVMICDDEQLIREALGRLIDAADDLEVVGTAANGRQAVEAVNRLAPDVVLMDVRMPVMDGIEATRRIVAGSSHRTGPPTRVLVLTTYDLDSYVHAALRAGASGFLLKDAPTERLHDSIRIVSSGRAVLAPEATARMIAAFRPALPTAEEEAMLVALRHLSDRERQVCDLIAEGMTNQDIARRLMISRYTVKAHVSSVLAKLAVPDRVHIVLAWSRLRGRLPGPDHHEGP